MNLHDTFITIFIFLALSTPSKSQNTGCLNFDGNSQLIPSTSQALNNIGTGDFTFEAWVSGEPVGNSPHPTIFSNRSSLTVGTDFFFHNYWGGSQSKMLCVQLNGLNYLLVDNGTYGGEILDGECHHVAVTRSGSTITFYVDGIPFGTRNIGDNPSISSSQPIWIGKDHIVNSTFNGSIENLKIWSIALTEQEINGSMMCEPLDYEYLEAHWRLNEGTGQLVTESVSNTQDHLGNGTSIESDDPIWGNNCCASGIEACDSITPFDVDTPFGVDVYLDLPNVVTPNMDNQNDIFIPVRMFGISNLHCVIFNRWGNLVYETDNLNIAWDASSVSDGVYYYIINYEDIHQRKSTKQGTIQVLK